MIWMQRNGKRVLTMALAVLMLFSSVNGGLLSLIPARAVERESITDGELLNNNYQLSNGEEALLLSGLLKENTYEYEVHPTAEDNLVEVDGEQKTISAKKFQHGDFVWYPKNATVINGNDEENVALAPDGDVYVGTFTTDGNTYSVQVTYELHINVSTAQQEQLLNAGTQFKDTMASLNKLATLVSLLDTKPAGEEETGRELLVRIVGGLMSWVDGVPIPVMPGSFFYYPGVIQKDDEKAAPIVALNAQMEANGGDLDLFVMLDAYNKSASQSQYLIEHGQELLNTAKQTADYLTQILDQESTVLDTMNLATNVMQVQLPVNAEDMADFYKSMKVVLNGGDYAGVEFAGLNAVIDAPWTVLDNNPLNSDLVTAQYQLLDQLVKNLPDEQSKVTIVEKLLAATATVQVNMNRYDILVKVVANVIERNSYDSTSLKNIVSDKTAMFTVNKGTTYEEVMTAIANTGIVADALADWEAIYQVGDTHYTQDIDGISTGDVVESDLTVTFTYTPKSYTLTGVEGFPSPVPYGYNHTLPTYPIDTENPENPDNKRVYDYEINGISYRQGSVYRVVADTTVVRTDGEPWVDGPWGNAIAHAVSSKASLVLQSNALNTGILSVRYPSNKVITLDTNLDGSTDIKAMTADSGIEGLSWLPARAYYVCENQRYPITNFENGEGSFDVLDYDKVVVEYELVLNGIIADNELLALMNLPAVLAQQAKTQKDAMDALANMKGALGQLADYINALKLLLDGSTLTSEGKAALSVLVYECYNAQTEKMYIHEYLNSYDATGLAWYYAGTNFEIFSAEFEKLKKCMNDFLDATPNLRDLMDDFNMGDKYDMVDGVREDLNNITLVAPHNAIKRNAGSDSLSSLVAAIEGVSATEIYTELPNIVATTVREQVAENKRSVTINMVVDGKVVDTYSMVFTMGQTLEQSHIVKLTDALATMDSSLEIDKRFYQYSAMELPNVDFVMDADIELTFSYTAKTIDAVVSGVGKIDTFSIHKSDISLPACGIEGFRYQYVIADEVIDTYNAAVVHTLTMSQKLFLLGGGEIRQITIDVNRQNLLDFIDSLNEALVKKNAINGAAFIPVEDANGNIALVWKISTMAKGFNAQGVFMAVAESIISSKFGYIDMGGYTVRSGNPVHIQGLLDAILDTGFSLTTVSNAINSDGTIRNMTLPGYKVVTDGIDLSAIPNTQALGGKMMETVLDLSTSEKGIPTSVKMYVTLGDDGNGAAQLKNIKNGLDKVTPYVDIHLINGNANLVLNLPDKAYQAFLAAMLVTDNVQLGTVNELDFGATVKYLYDLVAPVLRDDTITTDSFENTLGALNQNYDLSGAQNILKKIQDVLRHLRDNVSFANAGVVGNVYQQDLAYPIDNILTKLPIPETLLEVIAEKGGNLEATFGIQLKNLDTEYEALVIDMDAAGFNKVGFVTNLKSTLANIHNNAVVILVKDVAGDIVTDKSIYLDLNGKTVTGNVTGSKITVLDSTIGNLGKVVGQINGTDHRNNNLYETVVDGDNINVYLQAGRWTMDERLELRNIAFDLTLDLVLNYYTTAALSLNDDVVYSIDMGDVVSLLKGGAANALNTVIDFLKCDGLSNFANTLMSDFTDFAKLAEAAKAGDKLLSYTVGTRAWNVSISHDKENDYITGGIVPNQTEKKKTLNIFLGGTTEEKRELIDLLTELSKVVSSDIKVNLEDISYTDRVVSVAGSGLADIVIDTKGDHGYAVALGILLANTRTDKTDIAEALDIYFKQNKVAPLKKVIDDMTIAQLCSAVKQIGRNTDFASMAAKLNLNVEDTLRATQLMETYRTIFVAASNVLRTLDITGGNVKLSNYATEGENGAYDLTKAFDKAGFISIFGYDVKLDFSFKIKLFSVEPSFDDYTPEVNTGDIIYDYKLDVDNKQIVLDTIADGITLDVLENILTHKASNADNVEIHVDPADINNGKVVNGATIEFIASNPGTTVVDRVSYTVIIMGDTNSDGINSVADAVALMRHVMKEHDLTNAVGEYALLAADMNCSANLSVSDAVMIMRKCMNDNYSSELN